MRKVVLALLLSLSLFLTACAPSREARLEQQEHEDALTQAYEEGYKDGLSYGSYSGYEDGYTDGLTDGSVTEYVDEETRQANAEQASEMVKGSSTFSNVQYDYEECILTVTFRDSGKSYEYHDLPADVWEDFIYSDSLGKYYNANIKGKYASLKIDTIENGGSARYQELMRDAYKATGGLGAGFEGAKAKLDEASKKRTASENVGEDNNGGLSALQALADEYKPDQPISTPQQKSSTPKNYRTTWQRPDYEAAKAADVEPDMPGAEQEKSGTSWRGLSFAEYITSLLMTLIVYGLFPFLFSRLRKKPITAKKYRIWCYAVNFLWVSFFVLFKGKGNSAAYVIWTSVFAYNGVRHLTRKGLISQTVQTIK